MLSWLCTEYYDELPGLSLPNEGEGSQAEIHPLACGKNSDAITLLQEGSLLIALAVLPSNYGSLKLLDAAFALPFKAMTYQLDVLYLSLIHI